MTPAVGSLLLVVVLAVAFALDKVPAAVAAITAAMVCAALKYIPYANAFSPLAAGSCVLLASMMIVGGALFRTGLASRIAKWFLKITGTTERGIMVAAMTIGALLSSVLNNVGVVVCIMPIVMGMCRDAHMSPSRALMPLAYGAALGGGITLVGAASTVTANDLLEAAGVPGVNFLELAWIGVPLTVLSIIYIGIFGPKLIPDYGFDFTGIEIVEFDDNDPVMKRKQAITAVIFVLLIVCMAKQPFGLPLFFISSIGALVLVLAGCLTEKEAYASIDWPTIFIGGAMIAVGNAVQKTGGSKLIADWVVNVLGKDASPMMITVVVLLTVTVVTQYMSNVSTTTLMTPIVIAVAKGVGCDPKTLGIIVMIAANASLLTPVGAQAFTVIYTPGKYKFTDYFKVGIGMCIINTILAIIIVPMVWPF